MQFSTRIDLMVQGGVPPARLREMGLGEEHKSMSYGDVLRSLPEDLAVQLEFWRSAPGAWRAVARRAGCMALSQAGRQAGRRPVCMIPLRPAGLYAMARQFRILRQQPSALQVHYEAAQERFNGTMLQIAQRFWPRVRAACSRSC